jgi:hypothetical protein
MSVEQLVERELAVETKVLEENFAYELLFSP